MFDSNDDVIDAALRIANDPVLAILMNDMQHAWNNQDSAAFLSTAGLFTALTGMSSQFVTVDEWES